MKLYLVIPGVLVSLAGIVFTLQGLGIVGPPASFMYQSGSWILYGGVILVVGLIILGSGFLIGSGKKTAVSVN
ncbi:MAG: hypothetical protein M1587_02905 [Thaumarchaeota archaeon]|nr:hypothetical protein [Nitrososphaerota archaeon]MDG6906645.1 hypothetical protein [Nitrososphaerota archaeon]